MRALLGLLLLAAIAVTGYFAWTWRQQAEDARLALEKDQAALRAVKEQLARSAQTAQGELDRLRRDLDARRAERQEAEDRLRKAQNFGGATNDLAERQADLKKRRESIQELDRRIKEFQESSKDLSNRSKADDRQDKFSETADDAALAAAIADEEKTIHDLQASTFKNPARLRQEREALQQLKDRRKGLRQAWEARRQDARAQTGGQQSSIRASLDELRAQRASEAAELKTREKDFQDVRSELGQERADLQALQKDLEAKKAAEKQAAEALEAARAKLGG